MQRKKGTFQDGFFVVFFVFSGVCTCANHLIYEGVVTPPTDKIGAGFSPTIAIKHIFQQRSLIHRMKQQLVSQIGVCSTNQIQTCATGSGNCTGTCTKGWLYKRHSTTCGHESKHAATETQRTRKHIQWMTWHRRNPAHIVTLLIAFLLLASPRHHHLQLLRCETIPSRRYF